VADTIKAMNYYQQIKQLTLSNKKTKMGLYYRIWMDCITRLRSQEVNKNNWKSKSSIMMTVALSFNFLFFMAILQRNILGVVFYEIEVPFLSQYFNNIISGVILFILPIISINYILIFYGNRYERLAKKYPYYNGKLFITYFLISMFTPIIVLLIGIIIYQ